MRVKFVYITTVIFYFTFISVIIYIYTYYYLYLIVNCEIKNASQFKIDFGTKLMSSSKLPTLIDIGKHYLYLLNHNIILNIGTRMRFCILML